MTFQEQMKLDLLATKYNEGEFARPAVLDRGGEIRDITVALLDGIEIDEFYEDAVDCMNDQVLDVVNGDLLTIGTTQYEIFSKEPNGLNETTLLLKDNT